MTPEEFRSQGHTVVDRMADYLVGLPGGPVWQAVPGDVRAVLTDQLLPSAPVPFDEVLSFVDQYVVPYPFGNGHPRFFAWGNPPPALEGVLAELIAATMNPSCAGGDQAAVHLERCAVRWLAELVGFPGDGVLVSGGATAALTALTAARHRAAIEDGWDDRADGFAGELGRRFVLYVGDETHSCQRKAAQLLGIGDRGIRSIAGDSAGRMDPPALANAIRADRARGLRPFCVVASAGIVSTGAVDRLAEIAAICAEERLSFHVDGSLGGLGILDSATAPLFEGMSAADSLTLDPHKWLSVPIDCGAVLVRRLDDLRAAFSLMPPYLRPRPGDLPWFSEFVFDQTRPFRALKLWATLAATGTDELRRRISRNIGHARRLAGRIAAQPELELLVEPSLNIVAFRHARGDDAYNRAILLAMQAEGEVLLTGTRIDGTEAMRACFMNFNTADEDVDRIVPAVLRAAGALR